MSGSVRSLCAAIARTSTRSRFESSARLLALTRTEIIAQADFSPPPVIATSPSASPPLSAAQLFASDLVVSVDFCAASVIGQFLRKYDPRLVAFHHLLAAALVHTWAHAKALPTAKSGAPKRTALNSTLAAAPTAGSFFARLVIVASITDTEPLALECVDEFRSSTRDLLALLRRAPFIVDNPSSSPPSPPSLAQLADCEQWLDSSCDLLQNRLRFAFTANVSHDIMMHRALREFKDERRAHKPRKSAAASSPPEQR